MINQAALNIYFAPLLPQSWIIGAAIIAGILLALSFWKNRRGALLRSLTAATFILALLSPSLSEEQREAVSDVAVIVVDQSPSQSFGDRAARTDAALTYIKDTLSARDNLEVRTIYAPEQNILTNQTLLFSALEKSLIDVPPNRRAGVILISDGQIHDVPNAPELYDQFGPTHLLLSGEKEEKDRQLVMLDTPSYGIVGQRISLRYKIEDTDNIGARDATITITRPGSPPEVFVAPVNRELSMDLPIDHAGQNVFEISVQNVDGEITPANNRAAIIINGVRDRLKVLLVSGKPHAGGRTWRDLLSSDPGVDLVHFTILREPSKLDATPQNELALIAFPFRELFEVKLYDFDLIIFDRYRLNNILPDYYFSNIVRYVDDGGALLVASGPDFAGPNSLYNTPLNAVLPSAPTGEIMRKAFRPTVTAQGRKHPVTKNISWHNDETGAPQWGKWLRQITLTNTLGDVLMSGADEKPLLVLDRVNEGRVAQIASDHISLWARGYDGGGPYTEILRRTVHWLMKEPELDENGLDISVNGQSLNIRARNYKSGNKTVTMIKPNGEREAIELETAPEDSLAATIEAEQLGIYSFEDSFGSLHHAIIGDLNPPELRGVKTTDALMKDMLDASGGGSLWLSEDPRPSVKQLYDAKTYSGRSWIALRKNNVYKVSDIKSRALFPPWIAALFLIGLTILTWWREGRSD